MHWTACRTVCTMSTVRPFVFCQRAYAPLFSDALVTHPSRLETRTKEFSMQASLRVEQNPKAK